MTFDWRLDISDHVLKFTVASLSWETTYNLSCGTGAAC